MNPYLQFSSAALCPAPTGSSFFKDYTRPVPQCLRLLHARATIPFPQQNTAALCAYFPPHGGICKGALRQHFSAPWRDFEQLKRFLNKRKILPICGVYIRETKAALRSFTGERRPGEIVETGLQRDPGSGRANTTSGRTPVIAQKQSVPVNYEPVRPHHKSDGVCRDFSMIPFALTKIKRKRNGGY